MNGAVFLDRDGVINSLVYRPEEDLMDSPRCPEEFHLLPGAGEAIRLLNESGFLVVVASNQPGVAKGRYRASALADITRFMRGQLLHFGARLDGVYYCCHHPDGTVAELKRECKCRKPRPGLLLRAAAVHRIDLARSYMVGDRLKDVEAGSAAGCKTVLILGEGQQAADATGVIPPDGIASSLLEAARIILGSECRPGGYR